MLIAVPFDTTDMEIKEPGCYSNRVVQQDISRLLELITSNIKINSAEGILNLAKVS